VNHSSGNARSAPVRRRHRNEAAAQADIKMKRFRNALSELEQQENPLIYRNVRALTGELRGDCRLIVDDWRILFTPDFENKKLYVYAILPRGAAY